MQIQQAIHWATQDMQLDILDAQVLLAHVIKRNRTYLIAFSDQELPSEQFQQFSDLIRRRQKGEPVAYILGQREFWSLNLSTNSSTLIPRADTECLVELVINTLTEADILKTELNVVDLGTGTGAIALALASEVPAWNVFGIEFNADAASLAAKNAADNQLDVPILQGCWLDAVSSNSLDVIVSNPPYIDSNDPHLEQGDLLFEPTSALVAAENGFSDFRLIAVQAKRCLKKNGYLFFEHGYQQQTELVQILESLGFVNIVGHKDYAGQPRNVVAQIA